MPSPKNICKSIAINLNVCASMLLLNTNYVYVFALCRKDTLERSGLSFIFQDCGFPYFAKDVYNYISKGIDMQEVRNLAKKKWLMYFCGTLFILSE